MQNQEPSHFYRPLLLCDSAEIWQVYVDRACSASPQNWCWSSCTLTLSPAMTTQVPGQASRGPLGSFLYREPSVVTLWGCGRGESWNNHHDSFFWGNDGHSPTQLSPVTTLLDGGLSWNSETGWDLANGGYIFMEEPRVTIQPSTHKMRDFLPPHR
jgi:hypothetical protein